MKVTLEKKADTGSYRQIYRQMDTEDSPWVHIQINITTIAWVIDVLGMKQH